MTAPKAFISYSHDSDAHKEWTRRLATDLRHKGVDVTLDQWDLRLGQDVPLFMQEGIADSDRVVLVCSASYVHKAENPSGGVAYERLIVTEEITRSIDTIKFIPIVRNNDGERKIPRFLGARLYIDFRNDQEYEAKLEALARDIHGVPAIPKPPLGANIRAQAEILADGHMSLEEAASEAYGIARGTIVADVAEVGPKNSSPLIWMSHYFDLAVKIPIYGNMRFSPKIERINLAGYDFKMDGDKIIAVERGDKPRVWENMRVERTDLQHALDKIKAYPDS
jgi:hypothetical protein